MKTLTIYAVDDEPSSLRTIKFFVERMPNVVGIGYERFPLCAKEFLGQPDNAPDIVLLDVEMKEVNGLELADFIMSTKTNTKIIFITAHEDYAVASYKYRAVDYILKPFRFDQFWQAIERCRELLQEPAQDETPSDGLLTIKDSNTHKTVRFEIRSIFYIECNGNYTKMFLEDNTFLMPIMTLKKAMMIFESAGFLRVQKSYAINVQRVRTIGLDVIELANGKNIKIGRTYRKLVKDKLTK